MPLSGASASVASARPAARPAAALASSFATSARMPFSATCASGSSPSSAACSVMPDMMRSCSRRPAGMAFSTW